MSVKSSEIDLNLDGVQQQQQSEQQQDRLVQEDLDLGPVVGTLSVLQRDETSFYTSCLQKNSAVNDSTGSRVYTACHVLCR